MKGKALGVWLAVVGCASVCWALPRGKDYRGGGSESVPGESGPSANGLAKEPSCEELRAMWRFSKRQSRAAEITNEIPTYRDPFAYNVWEEYARPRSAGRGGRYRKPPIYGRVVHSAAHLRGPDNSPERIRAFEEVARLFGTRLHPLTGLPRRKTSFRLGGGGSAFQSLHPSHMDRPFHHLKELIRTERARELEEQRLSEEAERVSRVSGTGGPRVAPPAPAPLHPRVAFPDVLVPPSSNLVDDYRTAQPSHKYNHRYPDSNSVTGRRDWSW